MNQYHLYQYIQNTHAYIQSQEKQIRRLEEIINTLQQELTQVKEKPATNIERIEYKFDQLKIETLEGTLNIGLSPNGQEDNIEQFAVNQSNDVPHVLQQHPEIYPTIQDQVYRYLDYESHQLFLELETKYTKQIDPSHRQFIVDDVKKQIGERIYFYLNQLNEKDSRNLQKEEVEAEVTKRVQHDIDHAIEQFVRNMPKGGNF